jgi:mannan endo-1,4-beta-mannosidase
VIVARWCLGLLVVLCFFAARANADSFVTTRGTQFVLDGQPFYVTGVNNHYLSWGTDVEVARVLDDAVAMGANVVRTFLQPVVGAPDGSSSRTIWHSLRPMSSDLNTHGRYLLYWDSAKQAMAIHVQDMAQIDCLIAEAGKRHLKLILAFMDFWAYTGGAYQMSSWYDLPTHQGAPYDTTNPAFFTDTRVLADYQRWVKFVVERINPLTEIAYRDDPTIFAWELMNEAHAPIDLHRQWEIQMTAYVKSLDRNHLVGAGDDYPIFDAPGVDFVTWHGYPKYLGITPAQFDDKIISTCRMALRSDRPVLLEEFGYALSNRNPDQAAAYSGWLDTIRNDPNCSGWIVWRLVSRQENGEYPVDTYDQFDVHNDGGPTWMALSKAAHQGRRP